MSRRRLLVPLVAGLVAAGAAFVIASALIDDDPERPATTVAAPATGENGAAVFARMACGSCHQLAAAGSDGTIGPSLDERLSAHSATSLRAAIVSPPRGSMMPENFGSRMSGAELDALVAFLLTARR